MKAFDQTGQKVGTQINIDENTIIIRDIPFSQALKEVREYCKNKDKLDIGTIVEDLGIDLRLAADVVKKLVDDGEIEYV